MERRVNVPQVMQVCEEVRAPYTVEREVMKDVKTVDVPVPQ